MYIVDILEKILDNLPYPAYALDKDGKVVIWNKICEKQSGVGKREVAGTSEFWRLYGRKVTTPAVKILEEGKSDRLTEILEVDSKKFFITAFRAGDFVVEIAEDITGIEELKDKVNLFEKLVCHIKHFGMHTSRESLKRAFVKFTGDLVGAEVCEIYMKVNGNYRLIARNPPLKGDEIINDRHPIAYYVETGEIKEIRGEEGNVLTQKFGKTVLVPLISSHGIEGFVQIADISLNSVDVERLHLWRTILSAIMRRLRTEEELKEKIKWLETVVGLVNCGVVFVDCNTRIIYSSEKFEEQTGIKRGEKLSDHLSFGKSMFYKAVEQAVRGEFGSCFVGVNSHEFYVKVKMIETSCGEPVFCCIFRYRKCEKEVIDFFSSVADIIFSRKSHRQIAAEIGREITKLPNVLAVWFFPVRGDRKFWSTKNQLSRYLNKKLKEGEVKCLKIKFDKVALIECPFDDFDCPARNIFKNCFYYISPVMYHDNFYIFGVISRKKLDEKVVKVMESTFKLFSIKIDSILCNRVIDNFRNKLENIKTERMQLCDKFINPFTGINLLLKGLIDKISNDRIRICEKEDKEYVLEKMNKMYKALDRLLNLISEIKKLEDELIEKLNDIKNNVK